MSVHTRQFVLGPEPREVRFDWLTRQLPDGVHLSHCPTLPVKATPHGLVLGDPVATRSPDGGPDTWSGRWILIHDGELRMDAGGLLSCFMRETEAGLWASSSLEILRTLDPELPGHDDRLTRNWRVMDWYPPPHAASAGVSRLMVSQAIDISSGELHRVDLPLPGVDVDPEAAIERISQRLMQAIRGASDLAAEGGGRVWIGLTGGRDSRVVLAAAAAAGIEAMTYTFIRPETVQGDRDLPSKLAAVVGYDNVQIPLEVIDPQRAAEFDEHTSGGYTGGPQLQYVTGGWDHVEESAVALEGSGLELFRCFYFERLPRDFGGNPAGAADAMLSKFPSPRPEAIHAWAEWAFPDGSAVGMDWRDRIYLEQRIGGWLSAGLQGFDISGRRMVHIANDRSVISDMLSFPVPQRTDSVHTAALVKHMTPDLAAFPYNPGSKPKGKRGGKAKGEASKSDSASPDPEARVRVGSSRAFGAAERTAQFVSLGSSLDRRLRRARKRLGKRVHRRLPRSVRMKTRLWKPRIQSFEGRLRRQRVIHIIHIGKTAGLAIKEAIRGDIRGVRSVYQDVAPGTRILTHSHHITLREIPAGDDVVVILRDPVARFVSGFNSRQRQGMPKHFNAWKPAEARAFARFSTPDELASALSANDPDLRTQAEGAMHDIGHVRTHLSDWLGSPELIRSRRDHFLLVGWVETLPEDFERLRELIDLPADRRLPEDPTVAHQAPREQSAELGEESIRNLREWYRQDDELIDAMVRMGLTERPPALVERR